MAITKITGLSLGKDLLISDRIQKREFSQFLSKLGPDTQKNFTYFGKINSKNVKSIVDKELNRKDKIKFFTFLNGKLISYSFLTKFEKPTKKHNCILGIVISKGWQKKGLGKNICDYMIKFAWKKGFRKIWLTVYSDNVRAFKLYKSLGFEIEGIFMSDEKMNKTFRHIVSMALFNKVKSGKKERFQIWSNLEK